MPANIFVFHHEHRPFIIDSLHLGINPSTWIRLKKRIYYSDSSSRSTAIESFIPFHTAERLLMFLSPNLKKNTLHASFQHQSCNTTFTFTTKSPTFNWKCKWMNHIVSSKEPHHHRNLSASFIHSVNCKEIAESTEQSSEPDNIPSTVRKISGTIIHLLQNKDLQKSILPTYEQSKVLE